MKRNLFLLIFIAIILQVYGQCPTCGNWQSNIGENNINCPQDIPQPPTCTSCTSIGTYDPSPGIRQTWDFTGTTTFSTSGLPVGWSFASAPSPSTSGSALTNDVFGPRHGLVQPNCSGGCAGTNYFCIGNLANSVPSGSQKLGGNFDGRPNVSQNLSYVVLRGTGNPALVSPTFNFSGVQVFKIQFWIAASEPSCGQGNGWGSCTGNTARLDFSADGGTTWSLNMLMNTSTSNSDMCNSATSNTFWVQEGTWTRVCITVFRSSTSPGNFYTFANANTAPSGIMVNSTYFTNNFRFRIVYLQSASCNNSSATNPGRYLAVDYPVVTSGNQVIPCGISFIKMCGYGEDDNDEGVGSSTSTTTTIVSGSLKRGVNHAERGVEIFTSQNSLFAAQNANGSSSVTNYDLCNAEGGDAVCNDWLSNNNSYFIVYECLTDFEPSIGSVQVNYWKNGPQSFTLTKITSAGRTPSIGWRWAGFRYINCSNSADLVPGCGGYHFSTTSLSTQFIRVFYGLSIDNLGRCYAYYGPNSCTNYFNGPFISPRTQLEATTSAPNYIACNGTQPVFIGISNYCQNGSSFTGTSSISVYGPNNPNLLFETISSNVLGSNPITTPGEYLIVANPPNTPTQCLDCRQKICINLTASDIAALNCNPLSIQFIDFQLIPKKDHLQLYWIIPCEKIVYFNIQATNDLQNFHTIAQMNAQKNQDYYQFNYQLNAYRWFRIEAVTLDGNSIFSSLQENLIENSKLYQLLYVNQQIQFHNLHELNIELNLLDLNGKRIFYYNGNQEVIILPMNDLNYGLYLLEIKFPDGSKTIEKIWK